jgi:predicted RNA-binding Zn-ribbon protein involved in translation (DUF1610 family)
MSDNAYTYDELAAAVAASKTTNEIVRRLGREPSPGRNRYVMNRIRELEIDCSHVDNRPRLYTREMLAEAAAASTSTNEVVRYLGANEVGGTQTHIGRLLRRYWIDISHFDYTKKAPPARCDPLDRDELAAAVATSRSLAALLRAMDLPGTDYARRHILSECARHGIATTGIGHRRLNITADQLAPAAAESTSIPETMRKLGLAGTKNEERQIARAIDRFGIDTSHFVRRAWRVPHPAPRRTSPLELLTHDPTRSSRVDTQRLRRAMIEIGVAYECEECGTGPDWRGGTMTLEVDHINGDYTDNRPANVRFVCPNCHAITFTYCRKKHSRPHIAG